MHLREEEPGCMGTQLCQATIYTSCFVAIFAVILMILYFVDNEARIPFENRAYSYDAWESSAITIPDGGYTGNDGPTTFEIGSCTAQVTSSLN